MQGIKRTTPRNKLFSAEQKKYWCGQAISISEMIENLLHGQLINLLPTSGFLTQLTSTRRACGFQNLVWTVDTSIVWA